MSSKASPHKKVKQGRLPLSPVHPKTQKKRKLGEAEQSVKPVKTLRFDDDNNKLKEKDADVISNSEDDGSLNYPKKCEEKENINLKKADSNPKEDNCQQDEQKVLISDGNISLDGDKCDDETEDILEDEVKSTSVEPKMKGKLEVAKKTKVQKIQKKKNLESQQAVGKSENKNSRKRKMSKVDANQSCSLFKMFKKIEERGKQNLKKENNDSGKEKSVVEIDLSLEESDTSNHSSVLNDTKTSCNLPCSSNSSKSNPPSSSNSSKGNPPSSSNSLKFPNAPMAPQNAPAKIEGKTEVKVNLKKRNRKGKLLNKEKGKQPIHITKEKQHINKEKVKKLNSNKEKPDTEKGKLEAKETDTLPTKLEESTVSKDKHLNTDDHAKLNEKQNLKKKKQTNLELSENKEVIEPNTVDCMVDSDIEEVEKPKESTQLDSKVTITESPTNKNHDLLKKIGASQKRNTPKRKRAGNKSNASILKMFKSIEEKEKEPLKESATTSSTVCDGSNQVDSDDAIVAIEGETGKDIDTTDSDALEIMPNLDTSSEMVSDKESEKTLSLNSTCESLSPKTPSTSLSVKNRNLRKTLTPKQLMKEKELQKKREEREKLKLERDLLKKQKEEERLKALEEKQKSVEEKQKQKLEEQQVKEKDKEEKRLKREEERCKKEEEKIMKEEERKRKEEEKKLAEVEEKEKKNKAKAMFAQFFVTKKADAAIPQQPQSEKSVAGPFMQFQIKDNMRIAPVVRRFLNQKKKKYLDSIIADSIGGSINKSPKNYLEILKEKDLIGKSPKTFPIQEKAEENYCEILDEDDENIEGTDVVEEKNVLRTKIIRAKLLSFCENRRPAYYGTWSKRPAVVNGRNPLGKEQILDYEYDSDDDWEEEESGESLSDSEGEGDEAGEEGGDQYEVDNDFFVPHGYLSDDEGKDDDEKEEAEDSEQKDENLQKEQLKQKQEEFELEMKQTTKQLKPKVYGCVWVGDTRSHPAYNQLLKILSTHRAIVFWGNCPIEMDSRELSQELKDENKADEDDGEELSNKKFLKSFPEKAVPDLIRLVHGNRYSKVFLTREFSEYWKKNSVDIQPNTLALTPATPSGALIALRKIEPKIQELAQYGKYSEEGINHNYRIWYVPKEIRAKYGLEDLSVENTWSYTLPLKEGGRFGTKPDKDEKMECDVEDSPKLSKTLSTNLITKFTKVLKDDEKEEKKKRDICSSFDQESSPGNKISTIKTSSTPNRSKLVSSKVAKKRISLISFPKEGDSPKEEIKTSKAENKTPKGEVTTPKGKIKTPKSEIKTPKGEIKTPKGEVKDPKGEIKAIRSESETPKNEGKSSISAFFVKNDSKGSPNNKPPKTFNSEEKSQTDCITID